MKYCDSTIIERSITKKSFMTVHCFIFASYLKNDNVILLSGTKVRVYSFSLVRQQNQKWTQTPLLMECCYGRETEMA